MELWKRESSAKFKSLGTLITNSLVLLDSPRFIRASSSTSKVLIPLSLFCIFFSLSFCSFENLGVFGSPKTYRGTQPSKNLVADFMFRNEDQSLPIYIGGASLLAVLFNRTVSAIAHVADASK